MTSSSSTTSSWDFTPVINLLREPICRSEDLSTHDIPATCSGPSLVSHNITVHDVGNSSARQKPSKNADVSSPKLGDFGSLWELLGSTKPAHTSEGGLIQGNTPERPSQPHSKTKHITILQRPATTNDSVEKTRSTLQESPKQVTPNAGTHPKCNVPLDSRIQRRGYRDKPSHAGALSSSEVESDGSMSVFDPPLSGPKSVTSMIPPQVGVPETSAGTLETPPSSFDEADGFLTSSAANKPTYSGPPHLRSLTYRSTSDQRVGLLTKLFKDFPDYAETLVDAGRMKKSRKLDVSSRPIHVFVDMSNVRWTARDWCFDWLTSAKIMVGFHDSMKISRNIPVGTRVRRLPLSYQSFSLLLERGRPTAKRVLVGSDRIAAISESEQLGYEANILNRVQKTKQPTARRPKFRRNPKAAFHDGGQSSETNDAPEERWVEQGVDEILHLKILESLLDTKEPATIVLATGDAAQAEFSGGFLKMVERALQRGWRIELVSFSQVTSYAYKKKEFRSRWGSQFRMILLDDYVEELLKVEN